MRWQPKTCGVLKNAACSSVTMELKVPAASFDKAVASIKALVTVSEVGSWSSSVVDV